MSSDYDWLLRKLAHDLRGPILNLRMSLEVMNAIDEAQERSALSDEMMRELSRLDQLVERTLELGRVLPLQPSRVSLAAVVSQFAAQHQLTGDRQLSGELLAELDCDKILRCLDYLWEDAGKPDRLDVQAEAVGKGWQLALRDGSALPLLGHGREVERAYFERVLDAHGIACSVSQPEGGRGRTIYLSYSETP